jgi:hypothetical protein
MITEIILLELFISVHLSKVANASHACASWNVSLIYLQSLSIIKLNSLRINQSHGELAKFGDHCAFNFRHEMGVFSESFVCAN